MLASYPAELKYSPVVSSLVVFSIVDYLVLGISCQNAYFCQSAVRACQGCLM